MEVLTAFQYIGRSGQRWPVPAKTWTDGASIPRVLWSIVGGPFEGKYRKAAVVHDYYCDVRVRPWFNVHRMFYHGMKASGTSDRQAKLLYYAVRFAGPRWTIQAIRNARLRPHADLVSALAEDHHFDKEIFDIENFARKMEIPREIRPRKIYRGRPPSGSFDADRRFPDLIRHAQTGIVDLSRASLDELDILADGRRHLLNQRPYTIQQFGEGGSNY